MNMWSDETEAEWIARTNITDVRFMRGMHAPPTYGDYAMSLTAMQRGEEPEMVRLLLRDYADTLARLSRPPWWQRVEIVPYAALISVLLGLLALMATGR